MHYTKSLFLLAFIIMSSLGVSVSATQNDKQQPPEPKVVKAVAPQYPPLASAIGAESKVIVEVKINAKGIVTATKVISGLKQLSEASSQAAGKWEFAPTTNVEQERSIQLSFVYSLDYSTTQRAREITIIFHPPFQVEVKLNPGIVNSSQKRKYKSK